METQDLPQEQQNQIPIEVPTPPMGPPPEDHPQQDSPVEKKQQVKKRKNEPKPDTRARKFWRTVLGSFLGFILANFFLIGLGLLFIMMIAGSLRTTIPENSVLELTLDATIQERSTTYMSSSMAKQLDYTSLLGQVNSIGLDDVLCAIDKAKSDDKIKGISLNLSSVSASPASLEEIRRALEDFKSSGKFVYAYGDTYSQSAYYIASVADKVFLNPQGIIDFRGMCMQTMYYKGLMDKLDIDVEIVKHGRYKSAVEPYFRTDMSEASREQSTALVNSIWGSFTEAIARSRNVTVEELNQIADSLKIRRAADALQYKLVDELNYRPEYLKAIRAMSKVDDNTKITLVSLEDYKDSWENLKLKTSKEKKVAVIYAVGEIIDGEGNESIIGSASLCRDIRRAAQDETVGAIVMRVNSPGGSALASEVIWNEIEQAKSAGKVVVTSMGDYAASGGYYISCNSDFIIAEPTTITGSIGVFGMIPSFGNFLSKQLGVTVDGVATNAHADALRGYRLMNEMESEYMQSSVDATYATFLNRVSKGRKMSVEDVDSIGMGRVWTGKDALEIGLVNQLGNLQDAIKLAAKKAVLGDYDVVYYPKKQSFLEVLFNKKEKEPVETFFRAELGEIYPAFAALRKMRHLKGVQARMPMEIIIE